MKGDFVNDGKIGCFWIKGNGIGLVGLVGKGN